MDLRTDEVVAAKRLRGVGPSRMQALRRELAALRWAQVPGVVRVRDDFMAGGDAWIIMDHVSGHPFPGGQEPESWDELRRVTLRLLDALARLHFAGIVHRDIKPANVLVQQDGRVVIVDLGVAGGSRVSWIVPHHALEGTLSFAAPEQRWPPHEAGPPADLYAVGAMLWTALHGHPPHAGASARELLRPGHVPPMEAWSPHVAVPPSVHELVLRLLSPDLAVRPRGAVEVIRLLGGRPPVVDDRAVGHLPVRCEVGDLVSLFHGPSRFMHLPEDAARCLLERTGGHRQGVREELDAWIHAGMAQLEEGRVRVDRAMLFRLQSGEPTRLEGTAWADPVAFPAKAPPEAGAAPQLHAAWVVHLLRRGADAPEVLRAMDAAADEAERSGTLAALIPLVDLVIASVGEHLCPPELERLAAHMVVGALEQGHHDPLVRARRAVDVVLARCPQAEPLARLLAACCARLDQGSEAAGATLADLPEMADPRVEIARKGIEVLIALKLGPGAVQQLQETLDAWAGPDQERQAKVCGWRGLLAYRQLRMVEAAEWHLRSSALKKGETGRISSLVNAAFALLEAGQLPRAREIATGARAAAADLRTEVYETRAWLVLRQCAYRSGEVVDADPVGVEAAATVDPSLGAQAAMVEAAILLRRGERAACSEWSLRGARWARQQQATRVEALCAALALHMGLGDDPGACEAERGRLHQAATIDLPPAIALQVLALITPPERLPLSSPVWTALVAAIAPDQDRRQRREVLSLGECEAVLLGRISASSLRRGHPSIERV